MSSESWVEPRRHTGHRQDTQQTMDDQGQSDEKKSSPFSDELQDMEIRHEHGAKIQREKNKETRRRRRVKPTDEALPGV